MVSELAPSSSAGSPPRPRARPSGPLITLVVTLTAGWAVSACAGAPADQGADQGGRPGSPPVTSAVIEAVVDGDTVDLAIGGRRERVRLLGVDAPESVARHVPEQCFGREASEALAELLPPGSLVEVTRDVEARDRFGRLLLYLVRADDGLFVNRWLVETGLADAVSYEPNTTHRADLERARRTAVASGAGLWGSCDGPDQPLR